MRKKPMLAYPVSDKPINYNDKVFMQPKLDGVRCIIQYNPKAPPEETGVTAYSRTGKETFVSIFEVDCYGDTCETCGQYVQLEDKCVFVGLPTELIKKYKQNTNNDG